MRGASDVGHESRLLDIQHEELARLVDDEHTIVSRVTRCDEAELVSELLLVEESDG